MEAFSREFLDKLRENTLISSEILPPHYVCDLGMTHLRRFKQNNEGCLSNLITSFVKLFVLQCKICTWISAENYFIGFIQALHCFEISYLWSAIKVIVEQ